MPFIRENNLYLPGRKFQVDAASHTKNIRALEAYTATPQDLLSLLDKGVLPGTGEVPLGTIVRVGDNLWFLASTGWKSVNLT